MRFFPILLLVIALFTGQGLSFAAEADGGLPRDQVEKLAKAAHDLLPEARTGKGEGVLIGPEKAKTLVYPLIPYELTEFVVVRAHIAGFASHCGLDWQNKFYLPLMAFLRDRNKDYNEYQWAYVGILHGLAMGGAEQAVKDEVCTDDMKAKLLKEGK